MKRVAEWTVRDVNGEKRKIGFYKDGGEVVERIKKGRGVTHDIRFSRSGFERLVKELVGVRGKLNAGGSNGGNSSWSDVLGDSPEVKARLIDELVSSLSSEEVDYLRRKDFDFSAEDKLEALSVAPRDNIRREKTIETLMQDLYEWKGFNWFNSREYREWYESRYDSANPSQYLVKLRKKGWLDREDLDKSEAPSGYVKYKYRLSDKARSTLEEHGSFVEGSASWRSKKWSLPPEVRRKYS